MVKAPNCDGKIILVNGEDDGTTLWLLYVESTIEINFTDSNDDAKTIQGYAGRWLTEVKSSAGKFKLEEKYQRAAVQYNWAKGSLDESDFSFNDETNDFVIHLKSESARESILGWYNSHLKDDLSISTPFLSCVTKNRSKYEWKANGNSSKTSTPSSKGRRSTKVEEEDDDEEEEEEKAPTQPRGRGRPRKNQVEEEEEETSSPRTRSSKRKNSLEEETPKRRSGKAKKPIGIPLVRATETGEAHP
eukprot:TRINITY_DN5507_c0_g1_i2.p1 TRINITY_DN5507_c0_g1~~TRINITY_DN5507_c0_g1_i2.p1  ORF type:complete len:246 (+),score=105.12 TRINITY_DN5507_c0_g1_i2:71-808(+)